MSLKNHHNFHSVQFTTDIVNSFYQSLRGKADKNLHDKAVFGEEIVKFVEKIEDMVDKKVMLEG